MITMITFETLSKSVLKDWNRLQTSLCMYQENISIHAVPGEHLYTCSTNRTSLQHILDILKHPLQNLQKKCSHCIGSGYWAITHYNIYVNLLTTAFKMSNVVTIFYLNVVFLQCEFFFFTLSLPSNEIKKYLLLRYIKNIPYCQTNIWLYNMLLIIRHCSVCMLPLISAYRGLACESCF